MSSQSFVAILDTSSIIAIKELIPVASQPSVFSDLTALVQSDLICFPRNVVDELARWSEEDLPLAWARQNINDVFHQSPSYETVIEVMGKVGQVVDPEKEDEDADPYVLAEALEIQRQGLFVVVVTEDVRDKLRKISLATACQMLNLPTRRITEFLLQSNIWPKS